MVLERHAHPAGARRMFNPQHALRGFPNVSFGILTGPPLFETYIRGLEHRLDHWTFQFQRHFEDGSNLSITRCFMQIHPRPHIQIEAEIFSQRFQLSDTPSLVGARQERGIEQDSVETQR